MKSCKIDAFSSSFLSSMPRQHGLTISQPLSSPFRFNVYSMRIEDKPRTNTNSKTMPTISTPQSPTPPNNYPKKQPKTTSINRYKTQPPPPPPLFPSTLLNALEDTINTFVDPPTQRSIDPRFVLTNNFAPVSELPPTECEIIEGKLPSSLDGAYIRNGPNPQFIPRGPYHLFDGDGMLHSICISNGKATLCSRFVRTYKYIVEKEAGARVFPNVFSGFNGLVGSATRGALTAARVVTGQFNPTKGIGLANTSLAFFGNRLYALGESDLPYEIKITPKGDINTLGRYDFNGDLFMSMTAHPKVDLDTGETFAFRYGPIPPFLTFFRFDSKGKKHKDVPIFSMLQPSFLHDFGITKKYAIFADIQIGMDPMEMIMRGGSPVGLDPRKVSKVGVIPRYASDEKDMRWFEVPGFNIMHSINAWDEIDEEGNETIVLIAPNIMSAEHTMERLELVHAMVEKVKINLKTNVVTRQPLSTRNLDFGVLNPSYVGKKNKYVYAAVGDPMPSISGVVKLDVSMAEDRKDCIVASRMYGEGCYGGEPFFVANQPDNPLADEDDGYLVSYVHDEKIGESRFIVMDAKSPTLDVVASVKLPQRVPYGFHGLFVREKNLKAL